VQPSGAAELERGDPEDVALENALRKALAVQTVRRDRDAQRAQAAGALPARSTGGSPLADTPETVLGVDTLVTLHGALHGKPTDAAHARATLQALSGATHRVISGVALLAGDERRTALARTEVVFRELGAELLEWYLATGEWRARAGAYAIQGAGAALVREVRGDYENVVGLPLAVLLDLYPELLTHQSP
jgi:septum formation protein